MTKRRSEEHLSAERLQAFLEGELDMRANADVEEHLAGCARCAAELEGWRTLFADLDGLTALEPRTGFAERVMAGVGTPEPRAARAPQIEPAQHPAPGRLLDFLDGSLPRPEARPVEHHLAACTSCSAEVEEWRALFRTLDGLGRFEPTAGFADRVMAGVVVRRPLPLAARTREWLASLAGTAKSAHVAPERLQDFLEGALPARQVARIEAHLGDCSSCAAEADSWRAVLRSLGGLDRFAPAEGFAERVMAGVRVPVVAPQVTRTPALDRIVAIGRRLVPQTRKAWAALSGVAVTPAVTAVLVLYAVFSHPTLTPGALASFAWWQITDLAAAGWSWLAAALIDSSSLFEAYSLLGALTSAPLMVAGGLLAYLAVSVVALRVLYTNLINRPVDGRYARVSIS